jgi:hypothetical protein
MARFGGISIDKESGFDTAFFLSLVILANIL